MCFERNFNFELFSAWINETIAKITSPILSQDVSGAEMLILRHQEYNAEINSRTEVLNEFYQTGKTLIQQVCKKYTSEKCSVANL